MLWKNLMAKEIPNQIKSLMAFCSGGNNTAVVKSFVTGDSSQGDYNSWLINYGIIFQIEFLSGIEGGCIKWTLLTKTILDSIVVPVLCKVSLYQEKSLNIGYDADPIIYNRYFILTP